jgi:hypothetical protein
VSKPSYWAENLERLPWVRRLRKPVQCGGYTWRKMPLKALYSHGPRGDEKPPEGVEKFRCKLPAYWSYKYTKTSLKEYPARNVTESGVGHFCIWHIPDEHIEYNRRRKWWSRHGFRNARTGEWIPGTQELNEMFTFERESLEEEST